MTKESDPHYQKLLAIVQVARAEKEEERKQTAVPLRPHQPLAIPSSKHADRQIELHLYDPPSGAPAKAPVVINFHGSGYVFPSLGGNTDFCTYLARNLGVRVVDADYAKAPELPFPNCWHDVADVIRWTVAQDWCSGSIGLQGFSAGGALAIGFGAPSVAAKYGLTEKEIDAIKAVTAFYPPTGATVEERMSGKNVKDAAFLEANNVPGIAFDAKILTLFGSAYLYGSKPEDVEGLPELAPSQADVSLWTKPLTIITCEYDTLEEEASKWAKKLIAAGKDVELLQTEKTSHGWETRVTHDESQWTEKVNGGLAKKQAYELVVKRLKQALF